MHKEESKENKYRTKSNETRNYYKHSTTNIYDTSDFYKSHTNPFNIPPKGENILKTEKPLITNLEINSALLGGLASVAKNFQNIPKSPTQTIKKIFINSATGLTCGKIATKITKNPDESFFNNFKK